MGLSHTQIRTARSYIQAWSFHLKYSLVWLSKWIIYYLLPTFLIVGKTFDSARPRTKCVHWTPLPSRTSKILSLEMMLSSCVLKVSCRISYKNRRQYPHATLIWFGALVKYKMENLTRRQSRQTNELLIPCFLNSQAIQNVHTVKLVQT